MDVTGRVIGTVSIPVQYTKSLLQASPSRVKIGAFDDMQETKAYSIEKFQNDPFQGLWRITVGAVQTNFDSTSPENPITSSHSYQYTICFSEDLQRWEIILSSNTQKVYYLGSVDSKYTTHELVEYFGIPGF